MLLLLLLMSIGLRADPDFLVVFGPEPKNIYPLQKLLFTYRKYSFSCVRMFDTCVLFHSNCQYISDDVSVGMTFTDIIMAD